MTTLDIAEVRMFDKSLTIKERKESAKIAIQENIKSEVRFLCWIGKSETVKQSNDKTFFTDYKKSLSLRCKQYELDFETLVKEYIKTPREQLQKEL